MKAVAQENVILRAARPEDLHPVEALLTAADLPTQGVAEWLPHFVGAVYHLGDLVGYAPWPDEVVALERAGAFVPCRSPLACSQLRRPLIVKP